MKNYRDNGAIGALLDEYEKAIGELKEVIRPITLTELIALADSETKNEDCRSIQTVLTHVIKAGYFYAYYIRNHLGDQIPFEAPKQLNTTTAYQNELDKMFQFNVQLFEDFPNLKIEENKTENKILTNWGQRYDVEQMYEHAIVHILRHRRQIERFLLKLKS